MSLSSRSGEPLPLPAGFGLALDASVRRPRPEVLVGGWPVRVLRLHPAGAARVERWSLGEPVGPGPGAQSLARRLLHAGIAHPRPAAGSGPAAEEVTVVVPVRDRADGLAFTLNALGRDSNVVVVDDGSVAAVEGDDITVVRHESPRGPAAARNSGWRRADNDFIVFLDADCEPAPGWLAILLPHFADPTVGAVAPRITSQAAPGTPAWLAAYEHERSSLDLGQREAPVRPRSVVPYVPTAALVVRRQALVDVGGFDEALRVGEDVDLVWRLGKRGWQVRYEPAATVCHPARAHLPGWLGQRYQYGRSAAPLAARHGRAVAPAATSPWSAAAWALAAWGHPIAGAVTAAATSAALARRAGPDLATARTLATLALKGNWQAGGVLAAAIRRAWLPPAALWAGVARRPGPVGAALLIPPLVEWIRERPAGIGPLKWLAARSADDLAYQTGVWAGVFESRSAAALLPDW